MISGEERLLMKTMTGIRQVAPDLGQRILEIHGMSDRDAAALRRLEGKLLATTGGSVWAIKQLNFRERPVMLTHTSSSMFGLLGFVPSQGTFFPYPNFVDGPSPSPTGDWPSTVAYRDLPRFVTGPPSPHTTASPVRMTIDPSPSLIDFDTLVHVDGDSTAFVIQKNNANPGKGSRLRVSWDAAWLGVRYTGPGVARTLSSDESVALERWSSDAGEDVHFEAVVSPSKVSTARQYNAVVTFWVANAMGVPIDDNITCTLVVRLEARAPSLEAVTGDPTVNQAVKNAV